VSERLLAYELAMFALFRTESTQEYKRMVLFMVHAHIAKQRRISLNHLASLLATSSDIDLNDVTAATTALESVMCAVNKYHVRSARKQNVYQLSVLESSKFDEWRRNVLEVSPQFQTLFDASIKG
jgi:hypothetical protein